ncbi:MAG: 2-oxoacid:acceptor oxidoreductase family protein [Candidatus Shikimatogenerans bostrichidophilus]|nr:MAG: 2-oxoacid:acceptor oxidoreductase family protein [Candidatus Shikimatogenerans bostrichidophilus]
MKKKNDITIIISGFAGEGIQFMGYHLTYILYKKKFFIKTFSEIPSEIFSPKKDYYDISNYTIRFSKNKIISYEKLSNILVVTNYLSLKKNLNKIKKNSLILMDFNKKNLSIFKKKKKKIIKNNYKIFNFNSLNYINYNLLLKFKIKKISYINFFKNSFLLGIILYILNIYKKKYFFFFKKKIKKKNISLLNYLILKKGIKFGKKKIKKKILLKNKNKYKFNYKLINGNYGLVLGLISSAIKYNINIYYSSYPITPATNIYKYFNKYKKICNIKMLKSEDEISSICSAIGASFTGKIGITATSGPGMSLIQESLGLAVILELPLIVINVQRVGPSTGLPTKLEQSDLMQAIYGRHGESPIPVFSISNIKNSFKICFYALKIALEFMTPVIILSDIYISNNYDLWNILEYKKYKKKNIFKKNINLIKKKKIFKRNKYYTKPWYYPGYNYKFFKKKNYEHCIGSLEKNYKNNVSYNTINHEKMVKIRQKKINLIIKKYNNKFYIKAGLKKGKLLIISWGSTYDIIKESITYLLKKKFKICFLHLECIYPLNYKIINKIIKNFKKIIFFELNNKQLIYIIKSYCNILYKKIYFFNKIQGIPFNKKEIINFIKKKY